MNTIVFNNICPFFVSTEKSNQCNWTLNFIIYLFFYLKSNIAFQVRVIEIIFFSTAFSVIDFKKFSEAQKIVLFVKIYLTSTHNIKALTISKIVF